MQGVDRHVCSYIKDFNFDPKNVNHTIQTLSGGEQNRLLLSKILANPKTGLILDEPTNDLDLETLDMLTEMLSKYRGTLLIVSHDRDFLDQTVNKILYFDNTGAVTIFLGGYSDFLKYHKEKNNVVVPNKVKNKNFKDKNSSTAKLSFKYKFELEQLPKDINSIQEKLDIITKELKNTNLYIENHKRYLEITSQMEELNKDLNLKELRWLEIMEIQENLNQTNE